MHMEMSYKPYSDMEIEIGNSVYDKVNLQLQRQSWHIRVSRVTDGGLWISICRGVTLLAYGDTGQICISLPHFRSLDHLNVPYSLPSFGSIQGQYGSNFNWGELLLCPQRPPIICLALIQLLCPEPRNHKG